MSENTTEELSARECEILRLVATGATNQQIARDLVISVNTVKAHLRNIFGKLGVESRTEASMRAVELGLVEVAPGPGAGLVAKEAEPPEIPDPGQVAWAVGPGQLLALGGVILLAVAAMLLLPVPGAGARSSITRLVDLPEGAVQEAAPEQVSRWSAAAQMPTPRGRFAQVAVDGQILAISGLTEQGWSDQVEAYDPEGDRWERRAAKPVAVANVGAAAVGPLVYVPGGLDARNQVRDIVEVYDSAADTWRLAAPMPEPLCAYALAADEEGFFLAGGWNGHEYSAAAYYYHAASDTWGALPPLAVARGFAAAAVVDGRLIVVGGYDGENEHALCEARPAQGGGGNGPWQLCAPMLAPRAGHAAVAAEGALYVVGGGWDSHLAHNERYDPAHDRWAAFESPIIGEWRSLGLTALSTRSGTLLYAVGGWSGGYLGVVQAYQASYRIFLP